MRRREDSRFLTGRARFIDDFTLPRMLYVRILRSTYSHAEILKVDAREALRNPKVYDVLTGKDVAELTKPFSNYLSAPIKYYCMATDRVRYVGEPVAAVAAADRYSAEDALEDIRVDYRPLKAVVDPEGAMEPSSPLLHEECGSNVVWHRLFDYGDVSEAFKKADFVLSERFVFHRYAAAPIETLGCIANYDVASGSLTFYDNQQAPLFFRSEIAAALNVPEERIRFIEPDIGGGFGGKIQFYPYNVLTALLSIRTGHPVKWIETRSENLLASGHASGRVYHAEAAAKRTGEILGLKVKLIDDEGAYLRIPEPGGIIRSFMSFLGCYKIRHVAIDAHVVLTNKCPTGPYRGYGCQQVHFMLERTMDLAAARVGLDKAEIRLRNFIPPAEFPYRTPMGCLYDSGNYSALLKKALEKINYFELQALQRKLSQEGRYLGVGLACGVEPAVTNIARNRLLSDGVEVSGCPEAALVRVEPSGRITVALGSISQGHSHETTAAAIVAEELQVSPEDVDVRSGFDSAVHPWTLTSGTWASKFSVTAVGALVTATRRLREKLLRIASNALGQRQDDLEFNSGGIQVKNSTQRRIGLREIATIAYRDSLKLPKGEEPGLTEMTVYEFPMFDSPGAEMSFNMSATYGGCAHAAAVEVDVETGCIRLLKYVAVHDSGRILNPEVAEGQVHGGAVQGIGGSICEEIIYDSEGQLLTSSFMSYRPQSSAELPNIEVEHLVTPSPFTVLGTKGLGEGPAILGPSVIASAVEDALGSSGVILRESSLRPEKIWGLLRQAQSQMGIRE